MTALPEAPEVSQEGFFGGQNLTRCDHVTEWSNLGQWGRFGQFGQFGTGYFEQALCAW